MSVRQVFLKHLNRTVKLGRRAPTVIHPHLRFRNYRTTALPTPPSTFSYKGPAASAIAQIYLNDQLGDCVIACIAHILGVLTSNAGQSPLMLTQQQIIALYSAIGGYNPNAPLVQGPNGPENPTDQGCDVQTALAYWQRNGAPAGSGHKIVGYLAVDPKNPAEYREALYLFENLVYGIGLPDAWLTNPQPGFTWDAAPPDPKNGHCIGGVSASPSGVEVMTWGFTGLLTDAAHAADVDELYVALSQDSINKATQKAPNGFNWQQLGLDFNAMGGNVVVPPSPPAPPAPPSPPSPPSPPAPGSGPTLAQVLACDLAAFTNLQQHFASVHGARSILQNGQNSLEAAHAALFKSKP